MRQAVSNGDPHVRFDQGPYALGNLCIRIVRGWLDHHVGAPVTNVGCNSDDETRRTTGNIRLEPFADRVLPRPVFASKTLADDRHRGRTRRIPPIKAAPLEQRNSKRAEVSVAHSSIAGKDLSLDWSR